MNALRKHFSTSQIIILGFAAAILVGCLLLMLCDRTGGAGHSHSLVDFRTGSHSSFDSDWRNGCNHSCGCDFPRDRKKNQFEAEKHNAGCNFCT